MLFVRLFACFDPYANISNALQRFPHSLFYFKYIGSLQGKSQRWIKQYLVFHNFARTPAKPPAINIGKHALNGVLCDVAIGETRP